VIQGNTARNLPYKTTRIGEFLIKKGAVSKRCLESALEEQKRSGKRIGEILVEKKCIDETALLRYLGEFYGVDTVDLDALDIPTDIVKQLPYRVARRYHVIPVEKQSNKLKIVMGNPTDTVAIDEIRFITGISVIPCVSTDGMIERALNKYYSSGVELEELAKNLSTKEINVISETDSDINDIDDLERKANEEPVVKLVNAIISKAIETRASDIHIEPYEDEVKIRYRVDGKLRSIMSLHPSMKNRIVTRIKIMSKLNIAEKRLPQDGRMRIKVSDKDIDVRVSVVPSIYGEKVVLRILDKTGVVMKLDALGFEESDLKRFRDAVHQPYGIVLITGPTGAGKTTTLYASLKEIMSDEINIMTVEDPVEYSIKGITQVTIRESIGLTFPSVIRSFLRQDPDVILVGEIRDPETASIAVKAALTGHLVLATMHTNDAPTAVDRLVEMGVERYLIASSLIAVVAQRLVRVICSHCKVNINVPFTSIEGTGLESMVPSNDTITLYKGKGCENCDFTGYRGREAVYEVMTVSDTIRKMILEGKSAKELKKQAVKEGMSTLRINGLKKVLRGITTLEEVLSNTSIE